MIYHCTILPFESSQRANRLKATVICVWSSDAGGPLLMSGTFCFDGGRGARKRNSKNEMKLKRPIFVPLAKSEKGSQRLLVYISKI